jgi:hypothetical protein
MEIKLKSIYVSDQLSEETTAFKAVLYINNVQAGVAENEGRGGPTTYAAGDDDGRKLIAVAENWCKSLPPYVSKDFVEDNKPFTMEMDLELYLDNLVQDYIHQMELRRIQRRMNKDMEDAIIYGDREVGYRLIRFKAPIEAILRREGSIKMLYSLLHERVLPNLKAGEKILNTNIPVEVIRKLDIPIDKIVDIPTEKEGKKKKRPRDEEDARPAGKKREVGKR